MMNIQDKYNGLRGYTAFVVGAGNGIGKACAMRYSSEGAYTVISDIDEEGLQKTERQIKDLGCGCERYRFDVRNKDEADGVIKQIINRHGKIDIYLYSVGIIKENSFIDIDKEEWDRHIDINLNGAFNATQAVLRSMINQRFGKIIYIGSKSGLLGRPLRAAYCASKFGINGLVKSLALEVAEYNINVNSINPGRTDSEMTREILKTRALRLGKSYEEVRDSYEKSVPLGRLAKPEDIANMAVFLASEEGAYITGECISVSGGR